MDRSHHASFSLFMSFVSTISAIGLVGGCDRGDRDVDSMSPQTGLGTVSGVL
jgi:hypothetical protein